MAVWVQLTQNVHIEDKGRMQQRVAGDWVHVGKQYARQLIMDGKALSPFPETAVVEEPEGTSGIMLFGRGDAPDVGVDTSDEGLWEMRWHKTVFFDTSAKVNPVMYPVGFGLVNKWEIAVPLWDYRHLARDEEMDDDEREYTAKVIRDLRVPLYDIRLMFVRRCESTRRLFEAWEAEGEWTRLSFLRALYRTKPLCLALPVTWTGQRAPTHS
jgi:hypothetical protein